MKRATSGTKTSKAKKSDAGDQMGVKKGTSREKSSGSKSMKQKSSCMCGR